MSVSSVVAKGTDMDNETSLQRITALRMVFASVGTLVLLLFVLAVVRPDMAMSMLHHIEAMIGMNMRAAP